MNHKLQSLLARSRLGRSILWFIVVIRTKGKTLELCLRHLML